ncbi:MAG: nitrate- and nitrite sensing domain-containing protein [Streptosporangiaceae bacterium]
MRIRHRSVRLRIFLLVLVPVISLIGLYAFAAAITAGAAINLARSRTVKADVGAPTGRLEAQIGAERLLAVVYLAAPTPRNMAALRAQEHTTDLARAAFAAVVSASGTRSSATAPEKQAIAALLRQTAGLQTLRTAIATSSVTRPQAINAYSGLISAADTVLNEAILQQANVPLATQALAFVRMGKSEEYLSQEDLLLTGDTIARSFSAAERQKFTELAGARRALYAQTLPDLEPAYRAYYRHDVSASALAALTALENKVVADPHPRGGPPVPPQAWQAAVGRVAAGLSAAGTQAADELTRQAQPAARTTYLRLIVVGGLGLLAVLISLVLSVWIGRSLLRQLAGLRRSALELADDQLPAVMARLRDGEDVDVSSAAAPLEPGADEFGQVREAFNEVQRTALEAAAEEARLRRGVNDVFRNLARRSQSLLHRQLALLDTMERRASDPAELEDLYRIDHLTTRMRRHAESLIILSGESPGRGWRNPVPLIDVLRAAVSEVEDYTRIRVTTGTGASLAGHAVADVIHLLAELAENATIFSPPNTPVRVHGDVVGRGYAIEIEDRGLGIAEDKIAQINHSLAHPPEFDLSGSEQMGLFVAGRLAQRHDIRISLRPSPFGGTTAIVLIPAELVVEDERYQPGLPGSWEQDRPVRLARRSPALHRGAAAALAHKGSPATAGELPSASILAPADWPTSAGGPPDGAGGPGLARLSLADSTGPADGTGDSAAGRSAVLAGEDAALRAGQDELASDGDPDGDRDLAGWPEPPAGPAFGGRDDLAGNPGAGQLPAAASGLSPAGADDGPAAGNLGAAGPAGRAATRNPAIPRFRSRESPLPRVPFASGRVQPPTAADETGPLSPVASSVEVPGVALPLPARVRQASLAPQLRESGRAGSGATAKAPSPEAARSTMAALQRGWERGRDDSGGAGSSDAGHAPSPQDPSAAAGWPAGPDSPDPAAAPPAGDSDGH